jgi:hypothetical protein
MFSSLLEGRKKTTYPHMPRGPNYPAVDAGALEQIYLYLVGVPTADIALIRSLMCSRALSVIVCQLNKDG